MRDFVCEGRLRKGPSFVVTLGNKQDRHSGQTVNKKYEFAANSAWHEHCQSRVPRSTDLVGKVGGIMDVQNTIGTTRKRSGESGLGLPELLIAMAIITAVAAVALVNLKSARSSINVQTSVRQLARRQQAEARPPRS